MSSNLRTCFLALASATGACIPDMGAAPLADGSVGDAGGSSDGTVDSGPDAPPPDDGGPPRDGRVDAPPDSGSTDAGDLVAEGEYIFQVSVGPGQQGCARCHGPTARGELGVAPYNRCASRMTIDYALRSVDEMQFMDLTTHDVDAVAAYLASLCAMGR